MSRILSGGPSVQAIKATELSGYALDKDLSDALVIAISQSGTTTDTNRTVDLVKARGATVIAVVNRRNSDLVYKVDGVLYTSDGRDIEMSVASTKAFYSQVVAGYLLTYQLALAIEAMPEEMIYRELQELTRLPDLMRAVLADQGPIKELAYRWSPVRRDWAIVGSGPTRAAADEIRIKLSELCYKSIATDFIEDKKHIDLSSEPLTLICAAGLPLMALKDAVKEVAIFKSHKSVPIVICTEGFNAFEPYAAGVIYVPKASEAASVLLNTLVGHLWGYYSASAIDEGADNLRQARALAVHYLDNEVDQPISTSLVRLGRDYGRKIVDQLMKGRLNSSLSVESSSRLLNLFRYFNSGVSLRQFANEFKTAPTQSGFAEVMINTLTQSISELSRPIDAIKHQAKTITVGISRHEESYEGPIFEALGALGLAYEAVAYKDLAELRAMSPAIQKVLGFTFYTIEGLGPLGEVTEQTTICVRSKHGAAAGMRSRADTPHVLVGTKEWSVRRALSYIGRGRKDRRPIVIIPLAPRGQVETLALLHLEFDESLSLERKVTLLRDLGGRYDDLRSQVLETDTLWDERALESIATVDLVTLPIEQLTERVLNLLQGSLVAATKG
jgi:glucosamine--fructose-6-phosphate aminotransferase (isomerizing)